MPHSGRRAAALAEALLNRYALVQCAPSATTSGPSSSGRTAGCILPLLSSTGQGSWGHLLSQSAWSSNVQRRPSPFQWAAGLTTAAHPPLDHSIEAQIDPFRSAGTPAAPVHSTDSNDSTPPPLPAAHARIQTQDTAEVLQQAHVLQLREQLDDMAQASLHAPTSKIIQLAIECGAAPNRAEAEHLLAAMHRAGVILRLHETVYLRPAEIAEMVLQVLPGEKEEATAKLAAVEAELSALNAQHAELEKSAHRVTDAMLSAGFVLLAVQLGAFIWLTWWELSWDVMEPFGYIIQLFYSLVAYTYFLVTRGSVFDLAPFRKQWHMHFKHRQAQKCNFDEGRYEHLLKLRDRYKRHLGRGIQA